MGRSLRQRRSIPLTKQHIHLSGAWDTAMVSSQRTNFEAKTRAMTGYKGTPGWEWQKTWNLENYHYVNAFLDPATTTTSAPRQLDSDGATLYLPFGVPGTDARSSRDLKSATFRTTYAAECRGALADGAAGIFVDDVNMDHDKMFRRWNGSAYVAPLTDFSGGTFYTSAITAQVGWAALLADFLTDIRARIRTGSDSLTAYPNAKLMFNTQWYWLTPLRWTDARAIRMIDASDVILCAEHGFADAGHAAGGPGSDTGTDFYLRSLLKYVDQIQARGKSFVTFARSDGVRADAHRYEMALFHAKRSNAGGDMIGMWGEGDVWPNIDSQFMIDLGPRRGYSDDGTTITATFQNGSISVVPTTRSSAVINVTAGVASFDQLAFQVRPNDTVGINAAFNGVPATSVLDSFTRADNASIATGQANWASGIFTGWTAFGIVTNQASNSGTQYRSNYWNPGSTFAADQEVYVTIRSASAPNLYARITSPGAAPNGVGITVDTSTSQIFPVQLVAGASTQLGATISQAVSANDGLAVRVVGTQLQIYYRSGLTGSWTQIATRTTTVTAAGYIGFTAPSLTTYTIDDFGGGALPAAGPALNANATVATGVTFRPRFLVQEKSAAEFATGFELWFSKNAGAYTKVTAATDIRSTSSTQFTDGAATTKVLAAGTGVFVAGAGDTSGAVASISVGASGRTEAEFALTIPTGVAGDTYDLRVRRGGGIVLDLYTATPRITVA